MTLIRKKIFISIPWFTPAYKAGGPIRSVYNLVQTMKDEAEFFIFTSNEELDGTELPGIEANTLYKFNEYTTVYYSDKKQRSKNLIRESNRIMPDVLFVIGIYSWRFTLVPLFYSKASKKILSVRGMLHTAALQKKALKKNIFLAGLKAVGLQNKTSFHATDGLEAGFIKEVFGESSNIFIAENFASLNSPLSLPLKLQDSLQLISICLIGPMKNIHLVLQALRQCKSEIIYHIYGIITDNAYWNICLQEIGLMPRNVKVIMHGELLPHNLTAALKSAHIFIQPSASENFGHSIVEALSAGLPVITSNFTPWNNLEIAKAGKNVLLDSDALAQEISFFANMQQDEFDRWRNAAVVYIKNRYQKDVITKQYVEMFGLKA